ncbi:MAG: DJ-1/PfpI/YhbO family deglycase/protease [Candidatus Aenigmatarchaeota archaeon]
MKKVLYIIAQQNFRDEELKIPKKILEENGIKVIVASITREEARGMLGMRYKPEITVREANPNEYDALIIAGGTGSPKLADYPEVLDIIRRFFEQKKLIAAICVAPYILTKAGVLKGKRATAFPADFVLIEFRRAGVNYVEEDVVKDENIITASGPEAAEDFGKEIAKVLTS